MSKPQRAKGGITLDVGSLKDLNKELAVGVTRSIEFKFLGPRLMLVKDIVKETGQLMEKATKPKWVSHVKKWVMALKESKNSPNPVKYNS